MKRLRFFFATASMVLCFAGTIGAQITEHFTSEIDGSQSFSQGGLSFALTGSYLHVDFYAGWGYNYDDYYADNIHNIMGSAGVIGSITNSTKNFYVHSMYLAPGDATPWIGQYGNVIIRGKLDGLTQFTYTLLSGNISTSPAPYNFFTYIDLSSYNTTVIDQIEFELTSGLRYLAIDGFTFSDATVAPTLTTGAASSVAASSATLGGNITADGGATVSGRGVVYSSSDNTPTIGEGGVTQDANGTGTGSFSESIGSLSPGTTYYFQAYATNTVGTSYGGVLNFTTSNTAVTFTDGSGFATSGTMGNPNQVLGRFRLAGDVPGSALTAASIRLNGTRTGLSNLKLWISADASFGGDTQMGSTVAADPGDGGTVSFSGFSGSITTGGSYFFLTGDLASDASGKTRGILTGSGNLTLNKGTLSGSISNAPLSSADVSLPVELVSFSARAEGGSVVLNWVTESETDNLGFILERSGGTGDWIQIASYQFQNGLKGQGNTSSRTEYTFTDGTVDTGKEYSYRLSDVSTRGEVAVYSPITVKMDQAPEKTEMDKAYPNPFNPRTYIGYRLSEDDRVEISVYDLLGRRVKALFNGRQSAGTYHVYWNATDETGNKVPSGGYVIQMKTGKTSRNQKVLLMK